MAAANIPPPCQSVTCCWSLVQVADKSQEEGEKPRKQAIVEVMVDLLLDMEGTTVHKGLVYVLDEDLASYPVCCLAAAVHTAQYLTCMVTYTGRPHLIHKSY